MSSPRGQAINSFPTFNIWYRTFIIFGYSLIRFRPGPERRHGLRSHLREEPSKATKYMYDSILKSARGIFSLELRRNVAISFCWSVSFAPNADLIYLWGSHSEKLDKAVSEAMRSLSLGEAFVCLEIMLQCDSDSGSVGEKLLSGVLTLIAFL